MRKKITKGLLALAAIFVALSLAGCPASSDSPDLGNLSGGPKTVTEQEPQKPEIEVAIYGVKLGRISAEGGAPGRSVAEAEAGTIHLGDNAQAADADSLALTFHKTDVAIASIGYIVTLDGVTTPDAGSEWLAPATDGPSILTGTTVTGSYLIFKVKVGAEETYYKYLITWGQGGAFIETIYVGGRAATSVGVPYVGDSRTETAGIISGTIYLTATQIAAGRPIEAKLRSDSKDAVVFFAPSWAANDVMPMGTFSSHAASAALADGSRIFVRVQSAQGDIWSNYRIQVSHEDSATLDSFSVNNTAPASLGTPAGSWDSPALANGASINVKYDAAKDGIQAVADGQASNGTITWATANSLENEPQWLQIGEAPAGGIGYLDLDGFVYAKVQNGNYVNIYRFPVEPEPASAEAALTELSVSGRVVALPTPNSVLADAVAGDMNLTPAQMSSLYIVPTRSHSMATVTYAVNSGDFASAAPSSLANNDVLAIKVTAENGSSVSYYKFKVVQGASDDATASRIKMGDSTAQLGTPAADDAQAVAGAVTLFNGVTSPVFTVDKEPSATVQYAKTSGAAIPSFSNVVPAGFATVGDFAWVKITAGDQKTVLVYKIAVTVSNDQFGYGVPDPAWIAANRDAIFPGARQNAIVGVTEMPATAVWNARGHQHNFPDPFHFANGNRVESIADWENRRLEILNILQYYEHGIMPPIQEADGVEISWMDSGTGTANNCAITIKYQGRSWTVTINTTLPIGFDESNKWSDTDATGTKTKEGNGKGYGVYFGGANANGYNTSVPGGVLVGGGTFPMSGTWASETNGSGNVPTLFGLDYTLPGSPSANSSYAWGMSVILTVMENGGFRGLYNPNWVGLTGYSRNGKAAEAVGAFAMSRQGRRVGHVAIGSAGSGGPALERFLGPTGVRSTGKMDSWYDPLPVGQKGLSSFDDLKGKPWFIYKIENGQPMVGDEKIPVQATVSGSADAFRYRAVRGWAPYGEDFSVSPISGSNATTPMTMFNSTSIAVYQSVEYWTGIQSLSEGRDETPGWFSVRFKEFTDLHFGLDIDHVIGGDVRMPNRTKHGVLCTIPFDQHYTSVLIPPNGLLFQDGYWVPRNNPESMYGNWVICDEIFKFYGEAEDGPNGWDKYVWRNGFEMIMGTHGGNTGNEAPNRMYHARTIFSGEATTANALARPNLYKFREPRFNFDDPASRFDYYRMPWGRPGHPTIAERVKKYVEPILADYHAAESRRDPPVPYTNVANGRVTYPTYPKGYTPNNVRFKPGDWRGLLDEPELLPRDERWYDNIKVEQ